MLTRTLVAMVLITLALPAVAAFGDAAVAMEPTSEGTLQDEGVALRVNAFDPTAGASVGMPNAPSAPASVPTSSDSPQTPDLHVDTLGWAATADASGASAKPSERDDSHHEHQAASHEREETPTEPRRMCLVPSLGLITEQVPCGLDEVLSPLLPQTLIDDLLPSAPARSNAPVETTSVAPALVSEPSVRSMGAGIDAPLAGVMAIAAMSAALPAAPPLLDRARRFLLRTGLAAALYTRISRERLLRHEAREALLDTLRKQPGSAITDLAQAAGIPRNTATHHLHMLEKQGFVNSMRKGRMRLYFVSGSATERRSADAIAALRHDTTCTLARAIGDKPGVDQNALCVALGVQPSLAHWHVARLVESGVVLQVREGRRVRYYPGDAFHLVDQATALGPGV